MKSAALLVVKWAIRIPTGIVAVCVWAAVGVMATVVYGVPLALRYAQLGILWAWDLPVDWHIRRAINDWQFQWPPYLLWRGIRGVIRARKRPDA